MMGKLKQSSKRRLHLCLFTLLALSFASTGTAQSPRFHTRSIVACDPMENACGIAVVSFLSGVSSVVPVGRPGVVVATQGLLPTIDTANQIIENVSSGLTATDALEAALSVDPLAASRQLGVASLDTSSESGVSVASSSGSINNQELPETCNETGPTFATQASLQTSADICLAMAKVFKRTSGSLALRLLRALRNGGRVGADKRGEFSASVKVYARDWALSAVTTLSTDANVNRAANWKEELEFGVHNYLVSLTPPDTRNRIELTPKRSRKILSALKKLGYYNGSVRASWSPEAEQALLSFSERNQFLFPSGTIVDSDTRLIDGPLAHYIPQAVRRGVVLPAAR